MSHFYFTWDLTVTYHVRSVVEFFTCSVLSVLDKVSDFWSILGFGFSDYGCTTCSIPNVLFTPHNSLRARHVSSFHPYDQLGGSISPPLQMRKLWSNGLSVVEPGLHSGWPDHKETKIPLPLRERNAFIHLSCIYWASSVRLAPWKTLGIQQGAR